MEEKNKPTRYSKNDDLQAESVALKFEHFYFDMFFQLKLF